MPKNAKNDIYSNLKEVEVIEIKEMRLAMNLLFRFFFCIVKNLIFPKVIDVTDESILKLRVLPTDLDLNFHMNNGRYLTIMDIGRTDMTMKMNLHKLIIKKKLGVVTAGINILFFKELAPFSSYQLHSKILCWDENWVYVQQDFMKNSKVHARSIAKMTFTKSGKKIRTDIILSHFGENIKSAPMPSFLKELIIGEKDLVKNVKEFNRG